MGQSRLSGAKDGARHLNAGSRPAMLNCSKKSYGKASRAGLRECSRGDYMFADDRFSDYFVDLGYLNMPLDKAETE